MRRNYEFYEFDACLGKQFRNFVADFTKVQKPITLVIIRNEVAKFTSKKKTNNL